MGYFNRLDLELQEIGLKPDTLEYVLTGEALMRRDCQNYTSINCENCEKKEECPIYE